MNALEEFKAWAMKATAITAVLVMVVCIGLVARSMYLAKERDTAHAAIAVLEKKQKEAEQKIDAAKTSASIATEDRERAEAAGLMWRRKYEAAVSSIAPPAPPLPATDEEIGAQLRAKGLSLGVRVMPGVPTQMGTPDALKALGWANDATRLPSIQAALDLGQKTIVAQDGTILSLKAEVGSRDRVIDASQGALAAGNATIAGLKAEAVIQEKRVRNQKWQKWIFAGVAGFAGYRVGRR